MPRPSMQCSPLSGEPAPGVSSVTVSSAAVVPTHEGSRRGNMNLRGFCEASVCFALFLLQSRLNREGLQVVHKSPSVTNRERLLTAALWPPGPFPRAEFTLHDVRTWVVRAQANTARCSAAPIFHGGPGRGSCFGPPSPRPAQGFWPLLRLRSCGAHQSLLWPHHLPV